MVKSLLTSNATNLERALEENIAVRFDHNLPIDKLWDAQKCPVHLLPFLAWSLSVDVWDTAWPEKIKRQVIASSVYVHRHKGTRGAMNAALAALDFGVEISEWFEHGGDPYTFRADVMISTRGLTDSEFDNIFNVINNTKNARSHLSRLRVYLTAKSRTYFAAASIIGERIDVQPWVASVPISHANTRFAVVTHIAETTTTGENLV